jgi:hypothetical protein
MEHSEGVWVHSISLLRIHSMNFIQVTCNNCPGYHRYIQNTAFFTKQNLLWKGLFNNQQLKITPTKQDTHNKYLLHFKF